MEKGKEGVFKSLNSVMSLVGHKKSLKAVCLASNKKNAASLSESNVLKVWNTDVKYKK